MADFFDPGSGSEYPLALVVPDRSLTLKVPDRSITARLKGVWVPGIALLDAVPLDSTPLAN